MFQLIYLTFTQPRADQRRPSRRTSPRAKAVLANQQASPACAFSETLQTTLSQNHPRARPMTPDAHRRDEPRASRWRSTRTASPTPATSRSSSSAASTSTTMKPLVERYLGVAARRSRRKETWKDVGIRPPTGVVEKDGQEGHRAEEPGRHRLHRAVPVRPEHRVAIRALGFVLDTRLRETLREDLSGTYGVSVSPSYTKIPERGVHLLDPVRLQSAAHGRARQGDLPGDRALKTNGPTEKQVSDVREALLRDFETNMKQNSYLLTQIYLRYQSGEDLKSSSGCPSSTRPWTPR